MQKNQAEMPEIVRLARQAGYSVTSPGLENPKKIIDIFNLSVPEWSFILPHTLRNRKLTIVGLTSSLVLAFAYYAAPQKPPENNIGKRISGGTVIELPAPAVQAPLAKAPAIQNAPPSPGTININPTIAQLINTSSRQQRINPLLMPHIFFRESGYGRKPIAEVLTARSKTTARGICQMTEQPFLITLHREGSSLGLSQYARAIFTVRGRDGKTYYQAGNREDEILNLRNSPEVAIPVCAALIENDARILESALRRSPLICESDMAHFTGAVVAARIIRAYHRGDHDILAKDLAEPINYDSSDTNRQMFFRGGNKDYPYTVAEFYRYFRDRAKVEITRAPSLVN